MKTFVSRGKGSNIYLVYNDTTYLWQTFMHLSQGRDMVRVPGNLGERTTNVGLSKIVYTRPGNIEGRWHLEVLDQLPGASLGTFQNLVIQYRSHDLAQHKSRRLVIEDV